MYYDDGTDELSPTPGVMQRLKSPARAVFRAMPASQRAWRANQASGPRLPVPGILSERRILVASWAIAMVLVTLNERQLGFPLPRPARLWSATGVYGILALASTVDAIVPITNALGVGYLVVLGMDYFSGTGQFGTTAAAQGTQQ